MCPILILQETVKMRAVFKGDLGRFASPSVGQNGLNRFLEKAKSSRRPTEGPLSILVADKEISATGSYDPRTDALTITGYVR
jgi:hypothetical protein